MPWILEHTCDSRLWDVPRIQTLAVQPRTAWALADFCVLESPCRKRTLFLVGNVDNSDLHCIARKCHGTGGCCSVSGQKHVHFNASGRRSDLCSSCHHTRPPRLSFALAMVLSMNARRFQRPHPLRGAGTSTSASNDFGTGIIDTVLTCGSEPRMGAVLSTNGWLCLRWFRTRRRWSRASDECTVGDTR